MLLAEFESRLRLGDPGVLNMRIWYMRGKWHIRYHDADYTLCSNHYTSLRGYQLLKAYIRGCDADVYIRHSAKPLCTVCISMFEED